MSDSHEPTPITPVTDSHAEAHGGHHDMHLKLYWGIGFTLFLFTAITVALSYVDFGSSTRNVVIAMAVATFKVCLVGAIFMHLKGERPTIWRFLYFTAFFVLGLFMLTYFHWADPIHGSSVNHH